MLAALCGSIWQSHLMIKPAGLRKRFLAALLLSQMTKKCRNKSRGWVGMEVLKSYQDLTKRTMPSQEPEEHTAVITGAQPWDFKSKVTISLPGQQAICRISIPSTSAQRRMLSTASRWGTTTKEQWMWAVSPGCKQQFMVKIFTLANITRYKSSSHPDRNFLLFFSSFCCCFDLLKW